jgi:uncharacterized glyoxalase superfamily protein PhnB
MQASMTFYRDVLGLEAMMTVPDAAPYDWVMLGQGASPLVQLQTRESVTGDLPDMAERELGGGVMLFLQVGDVAALRERIEGRAPVRKDLHETFYGTREFAAEDPSGVVVVFAEDVQE